MNREQVGDVILAQWKANSRNAALLEEYLRIRGEEFLKLQSDLATGVPSGGIINSTTKTDVKPGAGAAPGERIEAPHKRDAIPESRIPHHERVPQTPGGTPTMNEGADVKPRNSTGGWFKRTKSRRDGSRFVEEPSTTR
jgi:hypothetical protein